MSLTAAWMAAGAAAVMALVAIIAAVLATKHAGSARRSSTAAEASAALAEQALDIERERHHRERQPRFEAEVSKGFLMLRHVDGVAPEELHVTITQAPDCIVGVINEGEALWSAGRLGVSHGAVLTVELAPPEKGRRLGGLMVLACRAVPQGEEWEFGVHVDVPPWSSGPRVFVMAQLTCRWGCAAIRRASHRSLGRPAERRSASLQGGAVRVLAAGVQVLQAARLQPATPC